MAGGSVRPRNSDLPVRAASAIAMLAIAGTALWLGGPVWTLFVTVVGFGVLLEWWRLSLALASSAVGRTAWLAGGIFYVGLAALALIQLRNGIPEISHILVLIGTVIAVDVGAYFAGRAIGGPKIAPSISPSKTWAGLGGGIVGAALVLGVLSHGDIGHIAIAPVFAVVAQAGDFFESWMKRRAGVKDSGNLIPGHGGLFDRLDGLLAVMFVIALVVLIMVATALISGEGLLPTPA